MKSKDELNVSLNELALLLRSVLTIIHAQPQTTQDYYGEYMSMLTKVAEMDKNKIDKTKLYLGIAVAMQRAGANKAGVASALRVMGVI